MPVLPWERYNNRWFLWESVPLNLTIVKYNEKIGGNLCNQWKFHDLANAEIARVGVGAITMARV